MYKRKRSTREIAALEIKGKLIDVDKIYRDKDQPMELQSCKFKEIQFTLKNLQTEGIKALHTNKKKLLRM